jgi:type II restriction enzyme
MRRAVVADRTPNLIAVHYDLNRWRVRNALLIPRFAFTMSAIERRPPLASTARRTGWVGCNIMLCNIPDDAKIELVREGVPLNSEVVRRKYSQLKPLARLGAGLREWALDVLKIARSMESAIFSLDQLYACEEQLKRLHPTNLHIKPKIRQQLQKLRDLRIIEFAGDGHYRFLNSGLVGAGIEQSQ